MANKKEDLHLRITLDEKNDIKLFASLNGFDTVSAYLLWLHRQAKTQNGQYFDLVKKTFNERGDK
jgi:hypothetical protein